MSPAVVDRSTWTTAKVDFVKLSPTENMTLLVRSRHPVADYERIAAELLSPGHVHAEQLGFIEDPVSPAAQQRLRMAGDEFCGNACMALAALTAAERHLDGGGRPDVVIEASGVDETVVCQVERRDSGFFCLLEMPLPAGVEAFQFPGLAPELSALVRYPDAVHVVVESDGLDQRIRDTAETVAAQLAGSADVSLVGVMLYDRGRGELAPLVTVPAIATTVWERSCGSGTASIGAYLAARTGAPVRVDVRQPGGVMCVETDHDAHGVARLRIGGSVDIVAEGTAYIHE